MASEPPISSDELARLVALVTAPQPRPEPAKAPPSAFQSAFQEWVREHRVEPGAAPAIPSVDLYRHFQEWTAARGQGFELSARWWGSALHGLGLARGRQYEGGRDARPFLMGSNAAAYFKKWIEENPAAPVGQGVWQPKRRTRGEP